MKYIFREMFVGERNVLVEGAFEYVPFLNVFEELRTNWSEFLRTTDGSMH